MSLPNWREWLYSSKALIAALVALYLALALSLPNPYWSVATVYIVSHPLSGTTRSKAIYRVFGTLIGAVAAVALVPNFVDTPILLSVLIAGWIGVLLYLALLDRTPRSYVFMLSAYSMPLIGLPTLMQPETVFDVALARSEEIVLGIVCASVVNTALFPSKVAPLLGAQMSALLRDGAAWSRERLALRSNEGAPPPVRHRLLTDVVAMDASIKQLAYDTEHHVQSGHARQMRLRMTMLIPQVASLFDPLYALVRRGSLPADVEQLIGELDAWMDQAEHGEEARADELQQRRENCLATLGEHHDVDRLLVGNALRRMGELIDLWRDCLALRNAYAHGEDRRPLPLRYHATRLIASVRHYDYGLLLFSAAGAALATLAATLLWIGLGWTAGASGVVLTAVACCFFAASDDPVPQIGRFLYWVSIGALFSLIYLFAILPQVHTYLGLALVLSLPLLLAGVFTGRPQFNMSVLLFTSQAISDLGLREAYAADFESFANSMLASVLGLIFAMAWTLLTKPFGAELAARRLARAGWRDLITLALAPRAVDHATLISRMLDRTCQLLPRLGLIKNQSLARMDAVRDVRVCLRLHELQHTRPLLDSAQRSAIERLLNEIGSYFRHCLAEDQPLDPPASLRDELDTAIRLLLADVDAAARETCEALAGLRLALFPEPRERPNEANPRPLSAAPDPA